MMKYLFSALFLFLGHLPYAQAHTNGGESRLSGPQFKRVFVVIFENTNADDSKSQPFMKSMIARGGYLNDFHALAHPSEPNYIAMVAGDPLGVADDDEYNLDARHLGDLLEAKGLTWKVY